MEWVRQWEGFYIPFLWNESHNPFHGLKPPCSYAKKHIFTCLRFQCFSDDEDVRSILVLPITLSWFLGSNLPCYHVFYRAFYCFFWCQIFNFYGYTGW
jgi:hypothetical protein